MPLLDILMYPDPRLRQHALPVKVVDNEVRRLVDNMAETMYAAPGIGLAAVQVNVALRIVVIDISDTKDDLNVFINPWIKELSGDQETEEGCLSVPGVFGQVNRAEAITVEARGRDGNRFELETDGLLSVCIQHEIDHLDGKVFVDYLSRMKQERIRKRLQKQAKNSPSQDARLAAG